MSVPLALFSVRIQELRASRGLSLAALARRADVSKSALGSWETGVRRPTPEMLRLVLDALQADGPTRAAFAEMYEFRGAWDSLGVGGPNVVDHGYLADMLLGLRVRAGLSQAELARRLGISQSKVSRWETGDAEPDEEVRQRLSTIVPVGPEERKVLDSLSNRAEPLITQIQRATRPFTRSDMIGALQFSNDRADAIRLQAALHYVRRRRAVDDRWTTAELCLGEHLLTICMNIRSEPGLWLGIADRFDLEYGARLFDTLDGQRIVMCRAIGYARTRQLSSRFAQGLARNAGTRLRHIEPWALSLAMSVSSELGETEQLLAISAQAEDALVRADETYFVPGIMMQYMSYAGLYEETLAVADRWYDDHRTCLAATPDIPHHCQFPQAIAMAMRGLGNDAEAERFEIETERILGDAAMPYFAGSVAGLRDSKWTRPNPNLKRR